MITCNSCGKTTPNKDARFCSYCGEEFSQEEKLPFSEETSPERGIFRLTFPPQELECDHEDEAKEAARRSHWDEEREFEGEVKIELVRRTATPETHPYVCGVCHQAVTKDTKVRCSFCEAVNWVLRTTS